MRRELGATITSEPPRATSAPLRMCPWPIGTKASRRNACVALCAWLADVLARLPDHLAKRIADVLSRTWCSPSLSTYAA